jgi:hypothetical protein
VCFVVVLVVVCFVVVLVMVCFVVVSLWMLELCLFAFWLFVWLFVLWLCVLWLFVLQFIYGKRFANLTVDRISHSCSIQTRSNSNPLPCKPVAMQTRCHANPLPFKPVAIRAICGLVFFLTHTHTQYFAHFDARTHARMHTHTFCYGVTCCFLRAIFPFSLTQLFVLFLPLGLLVFTSFLFGLVGSNQQGLGCCV